MNPDLVIQLVERLGFPVVVAGWLLYSKHGEHQEIQRHLLDLKDRLARLEARVDAFLPSHKPIELGNRR